MENPWTARNEEFFSHTSTGLVFLPTTRNRIPLYPLYGKILYFISHSKGRDSVPGPEL